MTIENEPLFDEHDQFLGLSVTVRLPRLESLFSYKLRELRAWGRHENVKGYEEHDDPKVGITAMAFVPVKWR